MAMILGILDSYGDRLSRTFDRNWKFPFFIFFRAKKLALTKKDDASLYLYRIWTFIIDFTKIQLQIRKFRVNFRAANFGGLVLEAQRELDKKFGHFQ